MFIIKHKLKINIGHITKHVKIQQVNEIIKSFLKKMHFTGFLKPNKDVKSFNSTRTVLQKNKNKKLRQLLKRLEYESSQDKPPEAKCTSPKISVSAMEVLSSSFCFQHRGLY